MRFAPARRHWIHFDLGRALHCAIAIIRNIGPLVFDPPPAHTRHAPAGAATAIVALHLALAFAIAYAMPVFLYDILQSIASGLQ